LLQAVAPAAEYMPLPQEVDPVLVQKEPAGHAVQERDPALAWNWPPRQLLQAVSDEEDGANIPAEQARHAPAETYLPAAQIVAGALP